MRPALTLNFAAREKLSGWDLLSRRVERFRPVSMPHDVRRTERVGSLGEGQFGSVLLLRDKQTGSRYALKAMSKHTIAEEDIGQCVQNERSVMMLMESAFVVRLFQTYQDDANVFFMMEPVMGGDLFDIYNDCDLFGDICHARFYIACVAVGLSHMHAHRVMYRDLKLENCLVDDRGYLKLSDMGIAKVVVDKTFTVCGTADYFAPETLKQVGHDCAVDWWACGVLLFILATGKSPFDAPEVTEIFRNIFRGIGKVAIPENTPPDVVEVVKALCRKKPEERAVLQPDGSTGLKAMSFFAQLDWAGLERRELPAPFAPPPADLGKLAKKRLEREVDLRVEDVYEWDGSFPEPLSPTMKTADTDEEADVTQRASGQS
jgi:serine/threonine protein kinase